MLRIQNVSDQLISAASHAKKEVFQSEQEPALLLASTQIWPSTNQGLGGIGEAAMTPGVVFVFYDRASRRSAIYHGPRLAYTVFDPEQSFGKKQLEKHGAFLSVPEIKQTMKSAHPELVIEFPIRRSKPKTQG